MTTYRGTYNHSLDSWTHDSVGRGVVLDTMDLLLDIIFTDGTVCWSKEAGALGLARGAVDSEEDLLRYCVYGSAISIYIYTLGRIRTLSIWTMMACIGGPKTLEILAQNVGFIKKIDPKIYNRLSAWLDINSTTVLPQYPQIHPAIELIEALCPIRVCLFSPSLSQPFFKNPSQVREYLKTFPICSFALHHKVACQGCIW